MVSAWKSGLSPLCILIRGSDRRTHGADLTDYGTPQRNGSRSTPARSTSSASRPANRRTGHWQIFTELLFRCLSTTRQHAHCKPSLAKGRQTARSSITHRVRAPILYFLKTPQRAQPHVQNGHAPVSSSRPVLVQHSRPLMWRAYGRRPIFGHQRQFRVIVIADNINDAIQIKEGDD